MHNKIGHKGQVVIEKGIRNRLGLAPGWTTVQMVVDGHVEMYFIPPPHNRSLAGILSKYVTVSIPDEEAFHEAAEKAWGDAAAEDWDEYLKQESQS